MLGIERTSVATISRSCGTAETSRSTRSTRTSRATSANSSVAGMSDSTTMLKSKRFQPLPK